MSIVNYDRISANYGGQALAMLQNNGGGHDHNAHPIMLTETEKGTIDFPRVRQIMSNHSRLPSEVAGLQPDILTPTVRAIDDAYRRTMDHYEDLLEESLMKDKENIIPLKEKLRVRKSQQPNYARDNFWFGMWFLLIGAIPGYFIGVEMNKWQEERDEIDLLREGSAHRRAWMFKVDALETQRYEDIKFRLRNEAKPLLTELRTLAEQDQHPISISKSNELTQLNKVYNAISPDEVLSIDGIIVNDYLDNSPILGGN